MICTCGDPTALGVVHLRTRPCFHYVKRTWGGLTDEEIQKERHLIDWTADWSYVTFARAIEAKLKEKNYE